MSRIVLLVGGSPALERHPESEAWMRGHLMRRIVTLPEGSVVLSSGEPGPGSWALATATAVRRQWVAYSRTGERQASWQPSRSWAPGRVHPHRVHQQLVEATLTARAAGWQAHVLVLRAPGEKSDGAGHLVKWAKRAGLAPEALTFEPSLSLAVTWQ